MQNVWVTFIDGSKYICAFSEGTAVVRFLSLHSSCIYCEG